MNASFAACDAHLTNFLSGIVPRNHTKVLRVLHIEKRIDGPQCGCGMVADWSISEVVIDSESLAMAGFYRAHQGYERD